jgi:uncharacterized protein (TIGR02231 family)
MKKLLIYTVSLFITANLLVAQPEKEINAKMRHVTVFPDRAQIVHEADISLAAGKTILKLSGLPSYIDPQGIQVKGAGDFTILSINFSVNYLQNLDDSPEIKSLRSQLEALQMKVEDENAAISLLKEKEAFLVANRAILVKETSFSVEQLKNVMELYTSNMDQVITTTLQKNRLIKDYKEQIEAIEQQLSDKRRNLRRPSGEIFITDSADRQTNGKLNISYITMGAGWYPSYDIRVTDITNPVTIYYKANVHQNTGVPWENVTLSFSNATPSRSGNIPTLSPWFIDYYQPPIFYHPALYGARGASPMSEMIANQEEEIPMFRRADPIPVEKQVGQTTVTFDVSIPYTIQSDGKEQAIEIQRLTTPADYKYVAIPKLSESAYLSANIVDWAQLSLQSGEASLYFDNAFIGETNLEVNQLKDTLTVSLGLDNSILVKREKRKDFTTQRVIGSNKTETYSFLLTVRNNKSSAIKISLQDQIPISSNSGITVEAVELSGGRHNAATGFVTWDLDLNPAETKQIILSYSVRYPRDRTIILE